ncbi:hypothetical protein BpHYR1_031094 [Brachionus plicatilis]|uniref:Uncharacterized protein n=1 Tax=Brachionus plicatilis TaxID=10195 RepID=A0A3M7SHW1_BRAPC|nr:hypothetical protein BpHYR1_031094 [Brachionus plicatilis]
MNCVGEHCSFSKIPESRYSWMQDLSVTSYSCKVTPKVISAKKENDTLFNSNCKATDLKCILDNSIIIWDRVVIHECPLFIISYEKFALKIDSDVLISESSLVFQVDKVENHCDLNLMTTMEGKYIGMKTNELVTKTPKENSNFEILKELLLSNIDFNSFKEAEDKNMILYNECLMFKEILKFYSLLNDEYINHFTSNGDSITFYVNMKTIYLAECVPTNVINIVLNNNVCVENNEYCFEKQRVIFYSNNKSYDGFLNTDGLITKTTKKVKCRTLYQIQKIKSTKFSLIRNKQRSTIIANENINYYTIDYLANKIKNFDAYHNPLILKNMDFLSFYRDTVNNEMLDEFLLTNNEDNMQASLFGFYFGLKLINKRKKVKNNTDTNLRLTTIEKNFEQNKSIEEEKSLHDFKTNQKKNKTDSLDSITKELINQ